MVYNFEVIDYPTQDEIYQINNIFYQSFNKILNNYNHDKIAFIKDKNRIVAFNFINFKKLNTIIPNNHLFIYNLAVDPNERNKGLCQKLIKNLNKKYGNKYTMYLNVNTDKRKPNLAAIRCYKKGGFQFVDLPAENINGYYHNIMIRYKNKNKNKKTKNKK